MKTISKIIKITKLVKNAQTVGAWGQPVKSITQAPSTLTQPIQQSLSGTPQIKQKIKNAISSSGLSKSKIMPFLQNLFMTLGDVPLSQIQKLINSLEEEQLPSK